MARMNRAPKRKFGKGRSQIARKSAPRSYVAPPTTRSTAALDDLQDAILELERSAAPKAWTRGSSHLYQYLCPLLAREDEVSGDLGQLEVEAWSEASLEQSKDASWDEVEQALKRAFPGVGPCFRARIASLT